VKIPRPDLAALGITALAILCIFGLLMAGHPIPDVLSFVAVSSLSAGAGISLNTPNGSETLRTGSSTRSPVPAPRATPAAAPAVSTPVGAP
jgi:hypothetical protein